MTILDRNKHRDACAQSTFEYVSFSMPLQNLFGEVAL